MTPSPGLWCGCRDSSFAPPQQVTDLTCKDPASPASLKLYSPRRVGDGNLFCASSCEVEGVWASAKSNQCKPRNPGWQTVQKSQIKPIAGGLFISCRI